jgi:glyoxylase-like metal-dependent hydrolase (beta-lactamase superfamily II)
VTSPGLVPEDWTTAGCYLVAPGVHRIPLPMPQDGLRAVNVYAVQGPDGVALVDAGWRVPGNLELLETALRQIDVRLEELRDVYVTHVHRDHYTLGPELRRATGARIHLGAGERPGVELIQERADNQPASSLRELRRAGAADLAAAIVHLVEDEPFDARDWESPDAWLAPGPLSVAGRQMEATAVPGHTKGHLVFRDLMSGHLFTGDHVLPTISPSIGFELGEWDLPLGRYLDSLSLLLAQPDASMLPAHGHPGGSVHERVRALLAHHDRRLIHTLEQVAGREATGLQVAAALPWTRRDRSFASLDAFNQMIAVCETMAHLDVLVERGAAVATSRDGVAFLAGA